MINVSIDASLLSNGLTEDNATFYHPIWTSQDISYEGYSPSFTLTNEIAINAFFDGISGAALAFEADPSSISSTQVIWGSTTTGVIVSGSSLSGIQNVDQLQTALEGGTGEGEFDTIQVIENGEEVLAMNLDTGGLKISSGTQSFLINGSLPQTFQEIFDFVAEIGAIGNLAEMSADDKTSFETFMADYGITLIELKEGSSTQFGLYLGSEEMILELEGAQLIASGTFPVGNLGQLVGALMDYADNESGIQTLDDLNQHTGINLTGLTILNDIGTEIASIQSTDSASTFNVVGTDNWDREVYIESFEDDQGNLVKGTYSLGGGADTALIDVDSALYDSGSLNADLIDGGGGWDQLIVRGYNYWDSSYDYETWEEIYTYVGPDFASFNFETGVATIEKDGEDIFSANITNFEAMSVRLPSFEFIGSSGDDKLYLESSFDDVLFEGGAGTDQLTLKYIAFWSDQFYSYEGITLEDFETYFETSLDDDGNLVFFNSSSGGNVITLNSVEEIRFATDDGGEQVVSTNEIWGISDSVGTIGDDELFGNSEANEITGLAGDDDIHGNGGADTLNGGDGHDDIHVKGGGATVDGGNGWNHLFLEDLDEDIDPELQRSLVITTNGSSGTAVWNEGDGTTSTTNFTNINGFKLDVDRAVEHYGSAEDDRVYIRNIDSLYFDGADGVDRLDIGGADIRDENGNWIGATREWFEDSFFAEVGDNGDIHFLEKGSGEVVVTLRDVEEVKFQNGTDEGELVSVSELVETSEGGLNLVLDETREEIVELSDGDDTLVGTTGDDTIEGGEGDDVVDLGEGDDEVDSGEGNDSVYGGAGNDSIFDATGDDTIDGGEGADQGVSLSGNNTFEDVEADEAPEYSPEIDDFYCGGSGNDIFRSGDGNDILIGDIASRYYFGDDFLQGGRGNDVMQAGYGADTFVFRSGDGDDVIGRVNLGALMSNWPADIADVPMLAAPDFEIGIDHVKLSGFAGVTDGTTLQSAFTSGTMSLSNNSDGNAVFDSGNGSITFIGIDANDLSVDDFIF